MIHARMTSLNEESARLEFAVDAAKHFAANPQHWTYADGDPTPGRLLALRWGGGSDCVLVVKLDCNELPVNFQEIIRCFPGPTK